MIADCLLKRFDLIADTPGNIPRLRKLIVDLAIRGKLVKKTSGDVSPEALLKRIAAKRELLIKTGKLRKQKPLAPIAVEELPAAYSAHCVFERLGTVAILEKGLTGIQSAKRGSYTLVVTAETRSTCDHFDFEGAAAIVPMVSSSGHGDASLKRLHYQEGKFALGNILCAVFPVTPDLVSARFLYEYLTAFKEELLVSKMIGTANVSLTMGKIGDVPVPIVPPAVQQKVEELMALCDALESAQREREAVRTRLRSSALHQLASQDSDSNSIAFVLQNLPRLTIVPENLTALRQSIRHIAMQGMLVRQNPKDESAGTLLKQIDTPAKDHRRRAEYEFGEIDEPPFGLPENWQWIRFGRLVDGADSGWSPQCESFPRSGDNWGVIKVSAVSWDRFLPEENKQLLPGTEIPRDAVIRAGDFLISRANTSELVAKAVVVEEAPEKLILSDKSVRLALTPLCERRYVCMINNHADYARHFYAEEASGTSHSMKNVSREVIYRLPIPLPPLAEQRRIVAKVDELMAVLDALEAALTAARDTSEKLLTATVAVMHAA